VVVSLTAVSVARATVNPTVLHDGRRFTAECAFQPDGGAGKTGTVSLTLVARDAQTGHEVWRNRLRSLWGDYGATGCEDPAFKVERLFAAPLRGGLTALRVHTAGGVWYVVDPTTGAHIAARLWPGFDALPPSTAKLVLLRTGKTAIQALPGYGFVLDLKNEGPAFAFQLDYPRYRVEGLQTIDGSWRKIVEGGAAVDGLRVVEHGRDVEVFVSADEMRTLDAALMASPAQNALRLGMLVYELDETTRDPVGLGRVYVGLRRSDLARRPVPQPGTSPGP